MKRIKTTFNTYSKLGKPTQSLINFLMNHGNIHFLMVTDENSLKNLYDGNETVESHEGNSYTVTFNSTETLSDNTEVVVKGWLYHSDQNETEYEFMDKYTITNNSFTVKVPADKDDNYDGVNLSYVKTLPVITHLTGAIRLDNVNEESGYDLTIPYCNLSNSSPIGLHTVTPSATNGRMNIRFVAKNNNDLVIKIVCNESSNNNTTYANVQLFHSLEDTSPFAVTAHPIAVSSDSIASIINNCTVILASDDSEVPLTDYVLVVPNSQRVTTYEPVQLDVTPDDPIILELKAITDTNNYLSYFNSFYGYDTPDSLISDSSLQVFKLDQSYDSVKEAPLIVGKKLNDSLSAPVNIALEPSANNLLENIPYAIFDFSNQTYHILYAYYGKLKLAKNPNAQIDYQLRSTSFTLKYKIGKHDDDLDNTIYYLYSKDVYYKIGVCPLDGSVKTRTDIVNHLKDYAFSLNGLESSSPGLTPDFNVQSPIWDETLYTFGESGQNGITNVSTKDIYGDMYGHYSLGLHSSAILPILNSELNELLGFMYIQLCNTDGSDFDVPLIGEDSEFLLAGIEVNKTESEPIDGAQLIDGLMPIQQSYTVSSTNYMGFRDHDIDGGFIPSVVNNSVTFINDVNTH